MFQHDNVDAYMVHHVCFQVLRTPEDYVSSSIRTIGSGDSDGAISYEDILSSRLMAQPAPNRNLCVLIGTPGSGKSTSIRFVVNSIHGQKGAPLVISASAMGYGSRTVPREAVLSILGDLYKETIRRLIEYWLRLRANDDPVARQLLKPSARPANANRIHALLQTVLLTSDIAFWADAEGRHVIQPVPGAEPLEPLFEQCGSGSRSVSEIASDAAAVYGSVLGEVNRALRDPEQTHNLFSAVLGFFGSLANVEIGAPAPRVVCLVDNLDHLPTNSIRSVIDRLQNIFQENNHALLVIALRESSVSQGGAAFIGFSDAIHHHAPSHFEVILQRLNNAILTRPMSELREGYEAKSLRVWGKPDDECVEQVIPFSTGPRDAEVEFFAAVASMYRTIMWHGMHLSEPLENVPQLPSSMTHSDHEVAARVTISARHARELARLVDALTGTIVRLGIFHCERFFHRIYSDPQKVLNSITNAKRTKAVQRVGPMGFLAESVLLDPDGQLHADRAINLFQQPPGAAQGDRPTLTHMHVLRHLMRGGPLTVATIIDLNSKLGVSRDESVRSVKYLSDRFSSLLWLSSNRDIKKKADDELVVLASHGIDFVRDLHFRFDYLWACGAAIAAEQVSGIGLRRRIDIAIQLLEDLLDLEYRQLLYRRLFYPGSDRSSPMYTLMVLYRAIDNISGFVARVTRRSARASGSDYREYAESFAERLDALFRVLDSAEGCSRHLYGTLLLNVDAAESREEAAESVALFRESTRDLLQSQSSADRLHSLLDGDQAGEPKVPDQPVFLSEHEDIVTRAARYGTGIIDMAGFGQLFAGAHEDMRLTASLHRVANLKGVLGEKLESRLPTFGSVFQTFEDINVELGNARACIDQGAHGIGGETLKRLDDSSVLVDQRASEMGRILEAWDDSVQNGHDVPQMQERSVLFRRAVKLLADTASELGLRNQAELFERLA